MFKMVQTGLGVAILMLGLMSQANGYDDQTSQSCRGGSQASPTSNVSTAPSGPSTPSSKPHGVTLSWKASVPASNSPADAIKGYNVYRREPGKEYEKINGALIQGTSCVDDLVKTGQTYYYETKAVSANGSVSKPSPEVKAVIPSR
jgi:hypothetical protein